MTKKKRAKKGDKRSDEKQAVNLVINQQDHVGRSLPDVDRIRAATVLHPIPGSKRGHLHLEGGLMFFGHAR